MDIYFRKKSYLFGKKWRIIHVFLFCRFINLICEKVNIIFSEKIIRKSKSDNYVSEKKYFFHTFSSIREFSISITFSPHNKKYSGFFFI